MSSDQSKTPHAEKNVDDSNVLAFKRKGNPIRCICPKCGITHLLKFFWSGNGTPRKYCHRCRETVSEVNDQYIYETIPDVFRIHRGVQPNDR